MSLRLGDNGISSMLHNTFFTISFECHPFIHKIVSKFMSLRLVNSINFVLFFTIRVECDRVCMTWSSWSSLKYGQCFYLGTRPDSLTLYCLNMSPYLYNNKELHKWNTIKWFMCTITFIFLLHIFTNLFQKHNTSVLFCTYRLLCVFIYMVTVVSMSAVLKNVTKLCFNM